MADVPIVKIANIRDSGLTDEQLRELGRVNRDNAKHETQGLIVFSEKAIQAYQPNFTAKRP